MGCTNSKGRELKPVCQKCRPVLLPLGDGATAELNYLEYHFSLDRSQEKVHFQFRERYSDPELLAKCCNWVCSATDRQSHKRVAFKKNADLHDRERLLFSLLELLVNRHLDHPNIVKMHDAFPSPTLDPLDAVYLVFGAKWLHI